MPAAMSPDFEGGMMAFLRQGPSDSLFVLFQFALASGLPRKVQFREELRRQTVAETASVRGNAVKYF